MPKNSDGNIHEITNLLTKTANHFASPVKNILSFAFHCCVTFCDNEILTRITYITCSGNLVLRQYSGCGTKLSYCAANELTGMHNHSASSGRITFILRITAASGFKIFLVFFALRLFCFHTLSLVSLLS